MEILRQSSLWQLICAPTLTLLRNRERVNANCTSASPLVIFTAGLQPDGARVESRVQWSRNARRRSTHARPNCCWGLVLVVSLTPLFSFLLSNTEKEKKPAGASIERQLAHAYLGFLACALSVCHLSWFADESTEKHVKQPLLGFLLLCASWRRRGVEAGKHHSKSIRSTAVILFFRKLRHGRPPPLALVVLSRPGNSEGTGERERSEKQIAFQHSTSDLRVRIKVLFSMTQALGLSSGASLFWETGPAVLFRFSRLLP